MRWPVASLMLPALGLISSSCSSDTPPVPTRGRVLISHEFKLGPTPMIVYTEGAAWFVTIETGADHRVVYDEPGGTPTDLNLPQGTYILRSYLRPCSGNCGPENLGGAADICEAPFDLQAGQELRVSVETIQGKGCTIEFG